jgi:hypothetical protein
MSLLRGNSSAGRAQPCQGWGREFESRFPLQLRSLDTVEVFWFKLRINVTCTNTQWLGGRVVMQRPAKPSTAVRFRPQPPYLNWKQLSKQPALNSIKRYPMMTG